MADQIRIREFFSGNFSGLLFHEIGAFGLAPSLFSALATLLRAEPLWLATAVCLQQAKRGSTSGKSADWLARRADPASALEPCLSKPVDEQFAVLAVLEGPHKQLRLVADRADMGSDASEQVGQAPSNVGELRCKLIHVGVAGELDPHPAARRCSYRRRPRRGPDRA